MTMRRKPMALRKSKTNYPSPCVGGCRSSMRSFGSCELLLLGLLVVEYEPCWGTMTPKMIPKPGL